MLNEGVRGCTVAGMHLYLDRYVVYLHECVICAIYSSS